MAVPVGEPQVVECWREEVVWGYAAHAVGALTAGVPQHPHPAPEYDVPLDEADCSQPRACRATIRLPGPPARTPLHPVAVVQQHCRLAASQSAAWHRALGMR